MRQTHGLGLKGGGVAWRCRVVAHDDIGEDAEEEEGQVGCRSPACLHDLKDRVRLGCFPLNLHCKDSEQQDLHCGASRIPEWPGHAVGPCDIGRLQEGGGPRPEDGRVMSVADTSSSIFS